LRVSSIRVFILSGLAARGEMHGHQLRLLAEEEHIDQWTDITVGALYGAIKRLAAEGLIEERRTEREGSFPPRQVWDITPEGREALAVLRHRALRELVHKPDPFDLAMTRLDADRLGELDTIIETRLSSLRAELIESHTQATTIGTYLTVAEKVVMNHKVHRLTAEIAWHEELLGRLLEIISDELSRKD
jgi:DNA-binding PadR family transcriptional regulator